MKLSATVFILSILFSSNIAAQSRVLLDEKTLDKCSVELEENFALGVLAAKREIEDIRFFKFDELKFIESRDGDKKCYFMFDLYYKKEFLGRAEIELSKPFWQRINRKVVNGNNTARW